MLLTKNNTKIEKGEALGYRTFGIHLAPYDLSGKNVCPNASAGCAAACLNTSGLGKAHKVQAARIKKTQYFLFNRAAFMAEVFNDIETMARRSRKNGMTPCFRLNLTSDLAWESIKYEGKSLIEHFDDVQFYDYTKSKTRMLRYLKGDFPANYHLTFSRSETNQEDCKEILKLGGNVAVVFRGKLPKTWMKYKVISGDETDLRFLDQGKRVIGLVEKGRAKKDKTGFVVEVK